MLRGNAPASTSASPVIGVTRFAIRTTTHATFSLERTYPASPARVFRAFADAKAKALWFKGPDDWDSRSEMDFRVGGHQPKQFL